MMTLKVKKNDNEEIYISQDVIEEEEIASVND